jgi:hypothetical protein
MNRLNFPLSQAHKAPFSRRLTLLALVAAGLLSTTLGGCRNWCHTSGGLQPKSQSHGTCTTPGELAQAHHRS